MKTQLIITVLFWMGLMGFAVTASPTNVYAAVATAPEQSVTGMVNTVDLQKQTVTVQGLSQKITLRTTCTIILPDKSPGKPNDLRVGEKAMLNYHAADGVLVGDRIEILELAMN